MECKCGKTKNENGLCDGSHNKLENKQEWIKWKYQ